MQQTQWSPRTFGIVACAAISISMATAAVIAVTDAPGRILLGIAAVGLFVFATGSWRARPKLAITDAGLQVGGWFRTQLLTQDDITSIRITEFRRLARKVRLLEIDTADDRLIVFTRWDLGTDPLDVLDALTEAGYAGRQAR
ncbi:MULTISPECIES: PH domain-containing protein [unclassified Mycobacterium]|uniref:PH domain-containing protein n=1 Tax=unclassified Mycobacterium TaxID=2642494 RepID=UPI0029C868DE|nr:MULTISPECIES: PH domain-containing protein [unclassified Mycobacterium]